MNYNSVLLGNITTYIFIGLGLLLAATYFVLGREVFSRKKKIYINKIEKVAYRLIVPIMFLAAAIYVTYVPIADYVKPDFKSSEGIIDSISNNSRNPIQFSVNIDNTTYIIPKRVISPNSLAVGEKYKFVYTSRKNIVEIKPFN